MNYLDKLRDPRWQRRRLEIFERDQWMCGVCTDNASQLHVHHKRYHREPWDAPSEDLITLCEHCHSNITRLGNDIKAALDFEPFVCFFQSAYDSIGRPNWFEIQTVFTWLMENPELVKKLYEQWADEKGLRK